MSVVAVSSQLPVMLSHATLKDLIIRSFYGISPKNDYILQANHTIIVVSTNKKIMMDREQK